MAFSRVNCLLLNVVKNNIQIVQICRSFANIRFPPTTFNLISNLKKLPLKNTCTILHKELSTVKSSSIHDTISSIQVKKRVTRKKKILEEEEKPGIFNVVAFATAEEYDLEKLVKGLKEQNLYEPKEIKNNTDVVHAVAKYRVNEEPREIFFFREGSVILWNITDLESGNILNFLREYEEDSYSERLVQSESEIMNYKYQSADKTSSCISKEGDFLLSPGPDKTLEKFTFSNAIMLNVKLGVWEASLEKYIDEIEFVTEDLKRGKKIRMSREAVLRKHGELFALRHYMNLSSDVLDTPDFYWDNEDLENLYNQVCSYFCINKRTKVMNEKINHCVELIELLSSHLSDKHHVRLEWMIIVLIMVEVFFEIVHYIDRFVH
ncbi:required for meiotic nuclear division protein 1 homolog [Leptinotarsa decemlineata]|uniref:required for meiotic nuclear division protein 1 homolog n=1 Tax=Leptinotarsa decemlineata TaxID=7539 RepID=UPI003D30C1AE